MRHDRNFDNLISDFQKFRKSRKFDEKKDLVRYSGPSLDESDLEAVLNSIIEGFQTGWLGFGKNALKFEKEFAKFFGRKFAVFTNSGSSANLLSIAALVSIGYLKKGDEIVTIGCTFPTTINPLILYGLKPVLVDIDLPSYTVNIKKLENSLSSKTKVVFLPHIAGIPHNMKKIKKVCETKKKKIMIIEDCCDALGSKLDNSYVGTFGFAATFSFYVAHHISSGEGGMVVTDDKKYADVVKSLRDWGRMPLSQTEESSKLRKKESQKISKKIPKDYEARYTYENIGFNLKPIDLQGALGLSQLKKIKQFSMKRNKNFKKLFESLKKYQEFILTTPLPSSNPSWFLFPITIKENASFSRSEICDFLEKHRIETRPMLAGDIRKHPAYKNIKFKIVDSMKNTEIVLKNTFTIGVYPGIDEKRLNYIIKIFKKFMDSRK